MAGPPWHRVKAIFDDAVSREPHARGAFLDEACRADAGLRQEVESLLASHDDAGDFLSAPLHAVTAVAVPPGAAPQPRRVGPYRVTGIIGQGGMGTVYRAVRDDDAFDRTVAVKLVRGGAASEYALRRFRQERQILAQLQHPNIATILDGGTTDEGHPYLVMDHVEGRPITAYCDENGLGTRERLTMFRVVCDAVQYAHQNLVVHRDLKPDNILVTADGTPKLLDFGIAKLLAAGVDPEQAPTATLMPMMTPEYASPEQVRGEGVTTASDVYSLGVLLYEILTGRRPYEVKGGSLEEIVRAVCQTNPPPPSAVVKTRRQDPAATLARVHVGESDLRGDLDTIVLHALSKEPERRYASVQDLSEDLRRHLEGLPVRARPDTLRYRGLKFVGRHRALVTATMLLFAALAAGLVATVREERIAEGHRRRAEKRFAEVRRLASSFMFEFDDAIRDLPGATAARKLVVSKALEHLHGLQVDDAGDPTLELEIATAYRRVGQIQGWPASPNLGDTKGALESYGKALDLAEDLVRQDPGNRSYRELLGRTHNETGTLFAISGDSRAAVEHSRRGLAIVEDLARRHPGDAALRSDLVRGYETFGDRVSSNGGLDEALAAYLKGAAITEERLRESPDDEETAKDWVTNRDSVAIVLGNPKYTNLGEPARALEVLDQGIDVSSRRATAAGSGEFFRGRLALSLRSRGEIQGALGDWPSAVESYRRAVSAWEPLIAAEPRDVFKRLYRAYALANLGEALSQRGQAEPALAALGQAIAVFKELAAADPANVYHRAYLAYGLALEADALARAGRRDAAMQAYTDSIDLYEPLSKSDPSDLQLRLEIALPSLGLGRIHVVEARAAAEPAAHCEQARPHLERARESYAALQRSLRLTAKQERERQEAEAGLAWCGGVS